MSDLDYDLARLLRPIEPEAFFRESWEKKPLSIFRNDPGYFHGLFSLRDVDQVISCTRPKFLGAGEFDKGGGTGKPDNFVQGWLADEDPYPVAFYPEVSDVHQAYSRGKTVILRAMQHRWPAIARLCRELEGYFSCPVHANLYLTPPGAQGFDAHYDTHEVFVLQLEGTKHWRFYGVDRDLPLAEDAVPVAKEYLGAPTQEALLQPGDLVYMPRGHIHEAFTSDCLSLHLTIGVRIFRWADLLGQALADVVARDVRFREALPPGLLVSDGVPATVQGRFRELLQTIAERARPEEAVDHLASSFLGGLSVLPGCFFGGEDAEGIDLETVLQRAPGTLCRVVPVEGGRVELQYPGNRVAAPARIARALRFVAQTPRFAVRELPDDLAADSKLLLARRLVRERFLTRVARDGVAE
jgi:hypothetical protein